jgi:hypothetical protein
MAASASSPLMYPVGVRRGHLYGGSNFLIAALYDPGKGLALLAQVIRALLCDLDNKTLWTQFVGEMQGPQLPLESGDRRSWAPAAPRHRNGTRRSRPIYSHMYAAKWPSTRPNRAQSRTCGSHPAGTGLCSLSDQSLLLMRKLNIIGAELVWLESQAITDRSYSVTYSSQTESHKTLPGIFLQHDMSWYNLGLPSGHRTGVR